MSINHPLDLDNPQSGEKKEGGYLQGRKGGRRRKEQGSKLAWDVEEDRQRYDSEDSEAGEIFSLRGEEEGRRTVRPSCRHDDHEGTGHQMWMSGNKQHFSGIRRADYFRDAYIHLVQNIYQKRQDQPQKVTRRRIFSLSSIDAIVYISVTPPCSTSPPAPAPLSLLCCWLVMVSGKKDRGWAGRASRQTWPWLQIECALLLLFSTQTVKQHARGGPWKLSILKWILFSLHTYM